MAALEEGQQPLTAHQNQPEVSVDVPGAGSTSAAREGGCSSTCGSRFLGPSSLFAVSGLSPGWVLGLKVANVVAFVAVAVVNALGGSGVIAGRSQGDVSDAYPTPITPSSYAFSIWSLIYIFQALLWFVYQWLPCANTGMLVTRVQVLHLVVCAGNIGWTFAFSYESMVTQAVLIWLMLVGLAGIYIGLHTPRGMAVAEVRAQRSWGEYLMVYVPFSLYTSWLLGACLISLFICAGGNPEEQRYAGMAALAFAAFMNLVVLAWARDPVFAGVNVWALVAIASKQAAVPLIWGPAVVLASVVGACGAATWALNAVDLARRCMQPTHQEAPPSKV